MESGLVLPTVRLVVKDNKFRVFVMGNEIEDARLRTIIQELFSVFLKRINTVVMQVNVLRRQISCT